nr:hypothetical protein [Tanacetum cinerariifolium]
QSCLHQIPQSRARPFKLRMYHSRVSASSAWSSQIHQRLPRKPMYPEYIPLEDEHVLLAKEQPLPLIDSPTTESSGYVVESDPKEDPEEYKDHETEDGSDEDEEDEEEEEKHLALADSAIIIPTVELVSPHEGTKPVVPPPSIDTTTTGARITVRLQAAISLPPEAETLKMASTQAFIDAITAALPSPPLPQPLYIPPPVDRRDDIPETEMPPRKRLCLTTLGSRYEIEESSTTRPTGGRGIDYGDTWVDPAKAVLEIAPMTVGEVNTKVTKLAELHEHDIQDLYALLDVAQDSRTRISQRVTMDSQWVDLLIEDRTAHPETILMVKEEVYTAREAWAHSIGLS